MLIERCPRCGESLASSTLSSTVVSCGRCSGTFLRSRMLEPGAGDASPEAAALSSSRPGLALPPHFRERYEVGSPLGRGTMGLVLRGKDRRDGREIAIKVLLSGADENVLARFLREAELLASVEHPHLVQILDLDHFDGHPCLVTEFLGGGTLRERMTGPMPEAEVVRIVSECLSALDACHAAGIIHRDLKPENILFDVDGTAKVADLGIAKMYGEGDQLTKTGAFIGTPRYMSPEQVTGQPASAMSDVYGMGAVAYELLSGMRPVDASTLRDLLDGIMNRAPPPLVDRVPGINPSLARAVERALAKAPQDRYPSAGAMGLALRHALDPASGPISIPRTSSGEHDQRRAAIRQSAQRAMASMEISHPSVFKRSASGAQPAIAAAGEPIVVPGNTGPIPAAAAAAAAAVTAPVPVVGTPAAAPAAARVPTPVAGTHPLSVTPVAGTPSGAASRPRGPTSGSGSRNRPPGLAVGRAASTPTPSVRQTRSSRGALAIAVATGLLAMAAAGLMLRGYRFRSPGDPRSVEVHPGITGVLLTWTSEEPYAAEARAEAHDSAGSAARETQPAREHRLLVTGLREGGSYRVTLLAGGNPLFPPLPVKLGGALELPPALRVTERGPDEMEGLLQLQVPVTVAAATSSDPGISLEASPGVTAEVRLTLRGPGAAAGLLDVNVRVVTVDGVSAERTLRISGAADRMRDYIDSPRLARDLEVLDRDIVNRRFSVKEREARAEKRLLLLQDLARLTTDLPAFEHALLSPAISLGRRARIYEILCTLLVMERLLCARLNVPEPGLTLPAAALVRRLADVHRLTERFMPGGVRTPPGAPGPGAISIMQSPWGKGGLTPRGPGMDSARAGTKMVTDRLLDVRDTMVFRADRRKLPRKIERVRITVLGRCLASHLMLVVWVNGKLRLRYFGDSTGMLPTENAATAFLTSDSEMEKKVPREELWLDVPAALLEEGENSFEITAHTLVAEMGANTVFCVPSIHEVVWEPIP